ncbi:MAG TPA: nicotinate-nucleotide--dimethylbenzimidazole phosphoribosyltransferase, partial [Hellea balneolensis]|nr:nicotinate-nucleotide--dimethylbenzimidazole phosphoribosyltransferase [Hellea balneolensis]
KLASKGVEAELLAVDKGLAPLGNLGQAISWLAAIKDEEVPSINLPGIFVFVGAHSVATDIIGEDPAKRASGRIEALSKGRAGIRGIAGDMGASFQVFEMGLEAPAADIRSTVSLDEHACAQAIAFGMASVSAQTDLLILGSAGVGSATAAAAIARGLYGGTSDYWADGDDQGAHKRILAVEEAVHFHRSIQGDPVKLLQAFGGHDLAGIFGAILAAGHQGIPVLLDGFVVCAAAALLYTLNPDALDHCYATHLTTEPAHGALLDRIGKTPLLDLGIGIGDGTGAALTAGLLRSACVAYGEIHSSEA